MKMIRAVHIFSFLLGLLLLKGVGCSPATVAEEVSARPEQQGVRGIGYVEPNSELRRLSFDIEGVIDRHFFRPGAMVPEGAVLAVLHQDQALAAVSLAQAHLEYALAEHERLLAGAHPAEVRAAVLAVAREMENKSLADRELTRFQELLREGATTQQEFDRVETASKLANTALRESRADFERIRRKVRPVDVAVSEAHVARARQALHEAETRLARHQLLAPVDGEVLRLIRQEGERVSALDAEPVLLFGDTSRLRVRAEIDERHVLQLRQGAEAEVHFRGVIPGSHTGTVTEIRSIMGRKSVFSHAAAERRDVDVITLYVEMPETFQAPVGLRVDVTIYP